MEQTDEELDELPQKKGKGFEPQFHYNIQVQLPVNGTEETYLNIFSALRKVFRREARPAGSIPDGRARGRSLARALPDLSPPDQILIGPQHGLVPLMPEIAHRAVRANEAYMLFFMFENHLGA